MGTYNPERNVSSGPGQMSQPHNNGGQSNQQMLVGSSAKHHKRQQSQPNAQSVAAANGNNMMSSPKYNNPHFMRQRISAGSGGAPNAISPNASIDYHQVPDGY